MAKNRVSSKQRLELVAAALRELRAGEISVEHFVAEVEEAFVAKLTPKSVANAEAEGQDIPF